MTDEPADLEPLRAWFRDWGRCVADVDFAAARPLFDAGVVGFGTHAHFVHGLDALEREQWRQIWPHISGFEFLVDDLVGEIADEMAWAAVPWRSSGYHEDGAAFDRPGRATVTFRRTMGRRTTGRRTAGAWRGTHTHFSLSPGTPARTYGRR